MIKLIHTCIHMYTVHTIHIYIRTYCQNSNPQTVWVTYIQAWTHAYTHTQYYIHVMRTYINMCVRTYTHSRINTYMHTYIVTYMHANLHTYTNMHIHKQAT